MTIAKLSGGRAEKMLDPGGWPDVDEDVLYRRAQEFTALFQQVTAALEIWQQQGQLFSDGTWSGAAARAANTAYRNQIGQLADLQDHIATAITWHRNTADLIAEVKSTIIDTVEAADREIGVVMNQAGLAAQERRAAVKALITKAHATNVELVRDTAERIRASKDWRAAPAAVQILLSQKAAPTEEISSPPASWAASAVTAMSDRDPPAGRAAAATVDSVTGRSGRLKAEPAQAAPESSEPGRQSAAVPAASVPGTRSPGQMNPAAARVPLAAGLAPGGEPMMTKPPGAGESATPTTRGAIPAAAGMTPLAAGVPGAPASTTQSARPKQASGPVPRDNQKPSKLAVATAIPVSQARAERDAIASATADAGRGVGGVGRLQLAARIAAALNAPSGAKQITLGFFWVTGVTVSGEIVVANSYGLAYIPDGVQLPDGVHMATADSAIPASQRAAWATYPVLAVQGWAAQRGTSLRVVIGTEEQLANSDSGAAKVVLKPDDIPDVGTMTGRDRLAVVDPAAATRLAALADREVRTLLPPVGSDVNAPTDRLATLWFDLMMPMTSKAPGREAAHLKAFRAYAEHAAELAVHHARAAKQTDAQRFSVADWLYWRYVVTLLDSADPAVPG